jgi:hypothetical protein
MIGVLISVGMAVVLGVVLIAARRTNHERSALERKTSLAKSVLLFLLGVGGGTFLLSVAGGDSPIFLLTKAAAFICIVVIVRRNQHG